MDIFAPRHLLLILAIVLLVFGTKKLRTIGSDLGGAVRGFKESMKTGESDTKPAEASVPNIEPRFVDNNAPTYKDAAVVSDKV